MSIKSKELLIEANKPFANCNLNREPYAEVLTSIVENYADGFVLAVDNEWGTGKTTFIKMWRQYLEDREFSTLYFNAWENDFENDVLVALISELKELKEAGEDEEKFKEVVDKAAPFVSKLVPALVKSIATKYVGEDVVKSVVDGFVEVTGEELKSEMQAYAKRKKGLKEFRDSLQRFIEVVTPDKPLVFFIDELDRCRPNYAVEVLEEIKHLFSVDGIVFVLSIDKEQLGHAIRGVYNSEKIKADEYLRRFIDLEFLLPNPSLKDYCNYQIESLEFNLPESPQGVNNEYDNDEKSFIEFTVELFQYAKLDLRSINKIISHTKVVFSLFSETDAKLPKLCLLLTYVKVIKSDLFKDINEVYLTPEEILNKLENFLKDRLHPNGTRYFSFVLSQFLVFYNNDYSTRNKDGLFKIETESYKRELSFDSILTTKDILEKFIDQIDFYPYSGVNIKTYTRKIQLTESFISK